jgi:hypothetical protein
MSFFKQLFGGGEPEAAPAELSTRIVCTATFLDGAQRYEAGDTRSVPSERATYFIAQGWATLVTEAKLDVRDGRMGLGDSNG